MWHHACVQARFARLEDADEVVRLAGQMFRSIDGIASHPEWIARAERAFRLRLGGDLQVAVVDAPDGSGLVASAAAVVSERLTTPNNLEGRVAYIQWVCTDVTMRRRGLGTSVMRLLLDWCSGQGVGVVDLYATPDAESVYRALGFADDGPVALRLRISPSRRVQGTAPTPP